MCSITLSNHVFSATILFFGKAKMRHLNYSILRVQKSDKHKAGEYKNLSASLKRETVQFAMAKNLAVNHLPLEASPAA